MHKLDKLHRALLALSLAAPAVAAASPTSARALAPAKERDIEMLVKGGYLPQRIEIRAGERVRLKLSRQEHSACSREVTFPELGLRRELPAFETVVIDLPALVKGEYAMTCGMEMLRGTLVVSES